MAAETMQLMSEGKDFQMVPCLKLKRRKENWNRIDQKITNGQVEFTSFESKEMNYKNRLRKLSCWNIDIGSNSLIGSETEGQTVQTTTMKFLSVSAA